MNRINIYEETEFVGWFDKESADEIASYKTGDSYTYGKILFATAKGKLVINEWSNTGLNIYTFADDEAEIAEILSAGGYDETDKRLVDILAKYEI